MSKHWFNNGIVQVFTETCPDDSYKSGMLESAKEKMRNHKKTDEHKKKISESRKGTHLSDETRNKLKGKKAWNKGKSSWCKGLNSENSEKIAQRNKKISESSKGKPGTNTGKKFTDEHKRKIGGANRGRTPKPLTQEQLLIKTTKQYLTRKKNNTFNTSQVENDFYTTLLKENQNKTIYRNYKDKERYPFYCDFYIVEDDLFIEVNAHWTHGGRPFDENDEACKQQLSEWQEKAKTSEFYKNAIETWTKRDVLKLETAKRNKLNYKTIY